MAVEFKRRPISVAEYQRMAETGILAPEERVELIDGEILLMSPIGRRHNSAVGRLNALLAPRFSGRALVEVQGSVVLSKRSQPEPDLALLRYEPTSYADRDVGPADIYALIEVGDTSRAFDRGRKRAFYARSGIGELWLVDVVDGMVTVCRDPSGDAYRDIRVSRTGDTIAFAAFPPDAFAVAEILHALKLPPPAPAS